MIVQQDLKERTYDLMNGYIDLAVYPTEESAFVENEFAEGSVCDHLYAQALEAYSRLCQRLGAEDLNDKDVEVIFNSLLSLCKHLSLKMYDYGALLTRKGSLPGHTD